MLQAALAGIRNALGIDSTHQTPVLSEKPGGSSVNDVSPLDVLPLELLPAILQFLPQDDVRRAAGVSRDFRAAARQAGLFIPCTLRWTMGPRPPTRQWDTFSDVMQYAAQHNCRVGLDFEFSAERSSAEPSTPNVTFRSIMNAIRDGLPWLVQLTVATSNAFFPDVYDALESRAPHLQELILRRIPFDGHNGAPLPVPANLFSRVAPNLRTLYITSVPLTTPVPAFSLVRAVCLSFGWPWPVLPIKQYFPRVSHLTICYEEDQETPIPEFDFSDLVLRELAILDNLFCPIVAHIESSIALRDIPVVRHICDRIKWDAEESLWREPVGPISARLQYLPDTGGRLTVIIVPARWTWRRVFFIHPALAAVNACPLIGLPDVYETLTYLRLDNRCIAGLLHLPFALRALRNLHVDFLSGHARSKMLYPPYLNHDVPSHCAFHVSCPVLHEVSLLALDAPIAVRAIEVAFLGRALGQIARPRKERARLLLAGITLAEPARYSQAQLEYDLEVFYSIKHVSLAKHPSRKIQLADFFWDY